MNTAALQPQDVPEQVGHSDAGTGVPHGATDSAGPASRRIIVGYGFWLFLLSDIIMFSAFFATYAVLSGATDGGPTAAQLFDTRNVALETACLLASSFACGMASVAVSERNQMWTQLTLLATGVLGAAFLALEIKEFASLVARGAGPTRSAFLTAFFTLVGCHGLHITAGLLWLGTMMAQFLAKGFRENIRHRFLCFSLFWHALDIIWIAIFSLVYLNGARA
ncbi:MAG: cytochrome o ubiquinol oxidase subunit [Gammaproteobacteria bacterium]|jgi:cytochrome o ubiquinol oxidase subunit 3|nr:cytochrome o ubiquinol oxidase subunit [Gammaproteobacteria bacterium]HEV7442527.1 cytochrome (ubi)quinol oxidase subunit III [Steroidobacteraceae bacterium]